MKSSMDSTDYTLSFTTNNKDFTAPNFNGTNTCPVDMIGDKKGQSLTLTLWTCWSARLGSWGTAAQVSTVFCASSRRPLTSSTVFCSTPSFCKRIWYYLIFTSYDKHKHSAYNSNYIGQITSFQGVHTYHPDATRKQHKSEIKSEMHIAGKSPTTRASAAQWQEWVRRSVAEAIPGTEHPAWCPTMALLLRASYMAVLLVNILPSPPSTALSYTPIALHPFKDNDGNKQLLEFFKGIISMS